jgi:hypothetical protein
MRSLLNALMSFLSKPSIPVKRPISIRIVRKGGSK